MIRWSGRIRTEGRNDDLVVTVAVGAGHGEEEGNGIYRDWEEGRY